MKSEIVYTATMQLAAGNNIAHQTDGFITGQITNAKNVVAFSKSRTLKRPIIELPPDLERKIENRV